MQNSVNILIQYYKDYEHPKHSMSLDKEKKKFRLDIEKYLGVFFGTLLKIFYCVLAGKFG